MSTPRKHLFGLLVLVGFITFISPGFIRQGVIYCNGQVSLTESGCTNTNLTPANGEFYLRYLSVSATMVLVAIIAGILSHTRPTMSIKIHTLAVLFALGSSFILIFNPPQVMIAKGDSAKYLQHAQSFQLGILSLVAPMIGLLGGYIFYRWMLHDRVSHRTSVSKSIA